MHSIIYTPEAERSLVRIAQYSEINWGSAQCEAYLVSILDTVALLKSSPLMGVQRPELAEGMRSLHVQKHTVYYVVEESAIRVIDILDQRRDPSLHLDIPHDTDTTIH